MRIIYEDGNDYGQEKKSHDGIEFEDISSVSKPAEKEKKIYRPAPSIRPAAAQNNQKAAEQKVQQPQTEQNPVGTVMPTGQPIYAAPPYVQGVPGGYPVQGYVVPGQAPQPYQPVQGYVVPGQYPYGQYMAYPVQQPVQPVTNDVNPEANPGTRVIYQSPDFDNTEKITRPAQPSYNQPPQVKRGIEQEDVDFSEESVPSLIIKSNKKAPVQRSTNFFTEKEDEIEMSVFELNAISGNRQPNVKLVSQPVVVKKGINEESFEREIEYENESLGENQPQVITVKPKKKTATSEIIRRIVLAVALVAIVVSLGMLLNEFRLSMENKNLEEDVSNLIIDVEPTTEAVPSEKPDKQEGTTKKNNKTTKPAETTTAPLTPAQQWEQLRQEYPNVIFPPYLQLKYAKLYATNQDFVGYLSADGVNLNLPIVQTESDEDYMKKNFYGKSTKYGCPFVTHLNNIEPLDMNTVIFGHHMNDKTVFGALDHYKSIEGFKKAPVITFNTIYRDYQWKVIAAFVTNALPEQDNGYLFRYYFTSLSTQERYSAFLNELSQRSLYDTGVDVLPTDKILTLSTCSHEFEEARFVVVARLVRIGETADVDVSKATVNPNPRYPQAYYDKKGKENPYKNASRWEVG